VTLGEFACVCFGNERFWSLANVVVLNNGVEEGREGEWFAEFF
jgi:hypothetical protein